GIAHRYVVQVAAGPSAHLDSVSERSRALTELELVSDSTGDGVRGDHFLEAQRLVGRVPQALGDDGGGGDILRFGHKRQPGADQPENCHHRQRDPGSTAQHLPVLSYLQISYLQAGSALSNTSDSI